MRKNNKKYVIIAVLVIAVIAIASALLLFKGNQKTIYGVTENGAFIGPFNIKNNNQSAKYNVHVACVLASAYTDTQITTFPGPADAMLSLGGKNVNVIVMNSTAPFNATIPPGSTIAPASLAIQCYSPSGSALSYLQFGDKMQGVFYLNYTKASGPPGANNTWYTTGVYLSNITVVKNISSNASAIGTKTITLP